MKTKEGGHDKNNEFLYESAYLGNKREVSAAILKFKEAVRESLSEEGYIKGFDMDLLSGFLKKNRFLPKEVSDMILARIGDSSRDELDRYPEGVRLILEFLSSSGQPKSVSRLIKKKRLEFAYDILEENEKCKSGYISPNSPLINKNTPIRDAMRYLVNSNILQLNDKADRFTRFILPKIAYPIRLLKGRLDKDHSDILEMLLDKLASLGFAKEIVGLVPEIKEGDTHHYQILLYTCATNGAAQEVSKRLPKIRHDEMRYMKTFLTSCAYNGAAKDIVSRLPSVMPDGSFRESGYEEVLSSCAKRGGLVESIAYLARQNKAVCEDFISRYLINAKNKEEFESIRFLMRRYSMRNDLHHKSLDDFRQDHIDNVLNDMGSEKSDPTELFISNIFSGGGNQDALLGRYYETRDSVFRMPKGGSNLKIMMRGGKMTFVNELHPSAAKAWIKAHEAQIPVAPIFKVGKRVGSLQRIYSRYCGERLSDLYGLLDKVPFLEADIFAQADRIEDELSGLGIIHGDAHSGNHTLECIDKDYFRSELDSGKTINTIEYNTRYFVDMKTALRDHARYEFVLRLIDWDMATY